MRNSCSDSKSAVERQSLFYSNPVRYLKPYSVNVLYHAIRVFGNDFYSLLAVNFVNLQSGTERNVLRLKVHNGVLYYFVFNVLFVNSQRLGFGNASYNRKRGRRPLYNVESVAPERRHYCKRSFRSDALYQSAAQKSDYPVRRVGGDSNYLFRFKLSSEPRVRYKFAFGFDVFALDYRRKRTHDDYRLASGVDSRYGITVFLVTKTNFFDTAF